MLFRGLFSIAHFSHNVLPGGVSLLLWAFVPGMMCCCMYNGVTTPEFILTHGLICRFRRRPPCHALCVAEPHVLAAAPSQGLQWA